MTSFPSHVDIEARTWTFSNISWGTFLTPREKCFVVVSVKAHDKDFFRFIEDILSSIAVMNVPIKDQNFFTQVYSILGRDSYIVEKAEARD